MNIEQKNLSYTGRDIIDIRQSLVNMVPSLTKDWSDFNESDLGMIIIELLAGVQDMQNFYLDSQAYETFLDTAVQPKNIRSLLRAMNYRIPLAGPARGVVRLSYSEGDPKLITVPKYTRFYSSGGDIEYLASDLVQSYNDEGFVDVPVMEGTLRTMRVTKKLLKSNVTTEGDVSRRIYLEDVMVADRSVSIYQDGVIWSEVDDALLEYNGGYVFSVHKDSYGLPYIFMSHNFIELLPDDEEEEITINYAVTRGTEGEVVAGYIDSVSGGDLDYAHLIRVENLVDTYGSWDEPDLIRLKPIARRKAQTMGRYITLEDYETGVAESPSVMSYLVKDWKSPEFVTDPYLVRVWAVGWNGLDLNDEDKKEIRDRLMLKGVSSVNVQMEKVVPKYFNVYVKIITSLTTEKDKNDVRNLVIDYIIETYESSMLSFGENISKSLIKSEVMLVSPYIRDALVILPEEDVEVQATQYPKLASVTVEVVEKF